MFRLSFIVLAFVVVLAARAQSITVVNSSFELPQASNSWNFSDADGPYLAGNIPGWTDEFGVTGEWAPILGPATFAYVPNGTQLGFAGSSGEASEMFQDVSANLTAGETYSLSVYIGNRADLNVMGGLGGYGYASIETASGTVLASSGSVLAPVGGYDLVTVSYTASAANPFLGDQLRIDLGTPLGSQASFDEVAMQATPEPATLALAGAGLAIGLLRRRHA